MERQRLESLTYKELREEVLRYGLKPSRSRDGCIDVIMSHLERNDQNSEVHGNEGVTANASRSDIPGENISRDGATGVGAGTSTVSNITTNPAPSDMSQLCTLLTQLLSKLSAGSNMAQAPSPVPAATSVQADNRNSPLPPGSQGSAPFYTGSPAQAVKLLANQLPDFSGSEDCDVDLWIEKVECVARIHGVADSVILLAATSKLSKSARKWFDMSTGSINESWFVFKEALTRRFKRTVSFQSVMSKVEARRWIHAKESFQEYAMDKLAIMQRLRLPDRDAISYLVNGIGSNSLRGTATALQAETVDQFLEKMHDITRAFNDSGRRSPTSRQKPTNKNATTGSSAKSERQQQLSKKEEFCVYCKNKGHDRANCFKLKKKEQGSPLASSQSSSSPVAAVEEKREDADSVIALVAESRIIETCDSSIKIVSINGKPCNLLGLLDTGSPISFIKMSIYNTHFSPKVNLDVSDRSYKAINNTPIPIMGTVTTKIKVEPLRDLEAEIRFHIFSCNSVEIDVIIGRDFLNDHRIKLLYDPAETDSDKLKLLTYVASADVLEDVLDKSKPHLKNVQTDFDREVEQKLITTLEEVESTEISPIQDDHCVKVSLKDESIYAYAPRRFAWGERLQIREITDDLLARGIIKPSISPYCARVVPVRKKNGTLRLCVDLRPLNERVVKQKYPFPLIEDCLARLSNKKIFSLLDLRDGFHQIRIHPEHTHFFSFATPDGQFEFNRLPFGYCEAPAEFQRRLIQILQPLLRHDKVIVYMDDILVASSTIEDNLDTLSQVLLLLKRYAFELNYQKCKFLRRTVEYLGYIVSAEGITLSDRHVEAVRSFPQPRKVVEVQRFLGLTNYFRRFIKDYAKKARPLHNLLKSNTEFCFGDDCHNAFEMLKSDLTSYPLLSLYDPRHETELHTDASATALAAILLQKQQSGLWSPVAYYSQVTNKAEVNYHSFELEMLAVVKAVERFHIYLYGINFTIITDCHALVYAVNKAHLNPRIARWTLRLQNYKFKVIHRAGSKMAHVDALSRIVALTEAIPLERELEIRQLRDSRLEIIAKELEFKDNDKFELIDGLVFKKGPDKPRFAIPEAMIGQIIRMYHDDMGHVGAEKTIQGICTNYWYPSLRKKVQDYIGNCLVCLMANHGVNSREGELQLTDSPTVPFHVVHTDHFGPILESNRKYKHILLIIDSFTRFTWLYAVKTTTSKETIKHFSELFGTFGNPSILVSDRGTAFTSQEFTEFLSNRNIKHRQVAVAAPWANGMVERVNRFLKSTLKKLVDEKHSWVSVLSTVQYIMNNTFHSSIKSTPAKLLLGFEQRNHADALLVQTLQSIVNDELCVSEERETCRDIAIEATEKLKAYNKMYYDKKHSKPTKYNPGDLVLIRDASSKPGESRKLKPVYKGPYQVDKVLDKNRFVIKDIPGYNVTSRPYNSILSPDRIKPWIKPVVESKDE